MLNERKPLKMVYRAFSVRLHDVCTSGPERYLDIDVICSGTGSFKWYLFDIFIVRSDMVAEHRNVGAPEYSRSFDCIRLLNRSIM